MLLLPFALAPFFVSCSDSNDEPNNTNQEQTAGLPELTIPSVYEVVKTERTITLDIKSGAVQSGDVVSLQAEGAGTYTPCSITAFTEQTVSFAFPASFADGTYTVYYRRGQDMRSCGKMKVLLIEKGFEPQAGTTIYGVVSTAEGPVEGALVSDGMIFARTNADGQYELASDKSLPYVFMVVPSGYEPERNGVFPKIFAALNFQSDREKPESVNFTLKKVDQSKFTLLLFADMHLANRNNDISQFLNFTRDVNDYCSAHSNEKIYALTLGDMSWDIYWDNFDLDNYVEKMNGSFDNLMVYQTMGNHDNDYTAVASNYNAKKEYWRAVGPNYYSFNIGEVHIVVLDNIDCSSYDGTTSRTYSERMMEDQAAWLRKDLSYVDKSTPVIVAAHAPIHSISGATDFKTNNGYSTLLSALNGYTVHFVDGHTHKNYNVTPAHTPLRGTNMREHNIGAVCGDWWWSGKLSNVLMAPDGTPGGYSIWDINGKDMKWIFKPTGKETNVQFRSYDLNEVHFGFAEDGVTVSEGSQAYNSFKRYVDAYTGADENYVLLNVWNYDPEWTITVAEEDGTELSLKQIQAYDPLHIAAMSVKRFQSSTGSTPNFVTVSYPHFFRVQASNADVDLTITVKDQFGNTWTETMERPKAFDKSDSGLKAYK